MLQSTMRSGILMLVCVTFAHHASAAPVFEKDWEIQTRPPILLKTPTVMNAESGDLGVGLPNNPDLIYDRFTGNVKIDADGANVVTFNLQSLDQFIPVADFSDLDNDVGFVSSLVDNTDDTIGWTSALVGVDVGYDGPPPLPALANLGDIFPAGLDEAGLDALLTNNQWGRQGFGGSFDLSVVPEPSSFISILLVGCAVATSRWGWSRMRRAIVCWWR